MPKYLIITALVAALLTVMPCYASSPRPLLIVAEEYPPYEYMKDRAPHGINVELVERILKKLDVPYTIKFYPFTRAWLMIEKGKADAIFSISYKPQREAYLHYTTEQKAFSEHGIIHGDYLWITDYVFFINRKFEKALQFESYEQIKEDGYRVGISTGYSYQPSFFEAGLNTFPQVNMEDSFRALVDGKIDVFPMDKTVGQAKVIALGLQDHITYLPKPLFIKPYLLGFSRKSGYPAIEQLMKNFYRELRDLRRNGEARSIRDRYAHTLPRPKMDRPLTFVCEEWRPFEFMKDGKPYGLDVAVLDRIMKRLNIPYEIKMYPWSRAWMMVEKGSADAVLSVSYKQSREPALYFTDGQRAFAESGEMPPNYLWLSEYVFFIKKKYADTLRFDSYAQITADGLTVGLNKDYSYNDRFMAHAMSFKTKTYYDTHTGFTALVNEEIDLYPMDKTVGLAELQNMGLVDSVVYLPKPLFSKPYLMPFVRGSDFPQLEAIMYDVYLALREMRASGEYQALYDRFISGKEVQGTAAAAP